MFVLSLICRKMSFIDLIEFGFMKVGLLIERVGGCERCLFFSL